MNNLIIPIVTAVLGANALFSFIQFLITRADQNKESPERLMLRALGSDRLYILLTSWKHETGGTASEWETIEYLFKGYSALGGNGEIRKLYEECQKIPTKD